MPNLKARLAWLWVGAGFFFQALPAALRDEALPVALKNAGITDTRITQLTGVLGILVGIKIIWAPLVVRLGSPRRIINSTQALIVASLGLLTLVAPQSFEHPYILVGLLVALSFLSAGHDIALDGYYVAALQDAERSRFSGLLTAASKTGAVFAGPGLIWIAGWSAKAGNAPEHAWADALLLATLLGAASLIVCSFALGREPTNEALAPKPFTETLQSLFQDARFPSVLLLILFYRTSEIHLGKILMLFSVAPITAGGLGLNNQDYATLRIFTAIGGLAVGGILGSAIISRRGLTRSLVPLGICMHIPIIGIAWLATHITQNPIVIGSFFFVEHVAYGTGVCALLLAMMRLASGADAAVRYATLSTIGIGAVYLPGIWAGWLADKFGYAHYFLLTLLLVPLGVWSAIRASRALDDVTPSVKG